MSYRGIIPPLITPLSDRDTLDVDGLERLIEHVIAGGVHGLFVLGTTGEGPSLSYRLRGEVIKHACRITRNRLPVFVGVTDTAIMETIRLAQVAGDAGAEAVVLATPYYFPAGQTELAQYINHLVPELPLPVMLYNMPSMTKVWFETGTLKSFIGMERIVGIKDSSGDLDYFRRVCELKSLRPDWSFFIGPEDKMIESISLGSSGGVNGGANIFPQLFVNAYDAAVSGDKRRCEELQTRITAFGDIYNVGRYASRFIKATKCAASILGLCDDFMAEPFNRFYPEDRQKVEAILDSLTQ